MNARISTANWFPQLDSYSRHARLYPALLMALPLAWTGPSLKAAISGSGFLTFFGSLGLAGAVGMLSTSIARERGKLIEPDLNKGWGGWRTTSLLRHRDAGIDPFTKARYHIALEVVCPGLKLPSAQAEVASPNDADDRYRSATLRLIEQRRGPTYSLLHKENAQYGFRRNLLGLKPIALCLLGVALVTDVSAWWFGLPAHIQGARELAADAAARLPIYVAIVADVFWGGLWTIIVRPRFVRLAADEYALALFRTLDTPAP